MNTKMFLKESSPKLLLLAGIVGFVSTAVMAAKARPKADKALGEYYSSRWRPREKDAKVWKEEAKVVFPIYARTIGVGILSTTAIISAAIIMERRYADMTLLYSTTEELYRSFRRSTLQRVGEKTMESIDGDVADERAAVADEITVPEDHTLFFDVISGRYFSLPRVEDLRTVVIKLNEDLYTDNFVPVNSYFYELGLEPMFHGDNIGWAIENGRLELKYVSRLSKGSDRPCVSVSFATMPRHIYDRLLV